MIRPARTLAHLVAAATCALVAVMPIQAQSPADDQVEASATANGEVLPPPIAFALSTPFYELGSADQAAATDLGYERADLVWQQLRFEPGESLIAVKIGEIIPVATIGSGPRVPISGFAPRAARLSDAWGVMLASSPEAAFDELPEDLQARAQGLGYSAGDLVVFTAVDEADPHLVLFDPCTGPELRVRLPESRKRFDMHLGRMEGFQQFMGCALFDDLHRKVQAEVAAHGYGPGDRVRLVYDSSQDSTSVVPRR